MGVEIPITGITDSFRPPGVWGELVVAQGKGAANVGEREAVVVGPILSTALWTAATLYPTTNEQDFIDGAVAGSPLHRLGRAFRNANPLTTLSALGVAETSGGSPVPADVDVTVAGTANAAGGVWIDSLIDRTSSPFCTISSNSRWLRRTASLVPHCART